MQLLEEGVEIHVALDDITTLFRVSAAAARQEKQPRSKPGPKKRSGQPAALLWEGLDYWVSRLTLSTTNDVCSDASSVITNDRVTVWPLYGSRLKLRIW